MIPKFIRLQDKKIPETPGVYFMKNAAGQILYIGKAGNLRRRVDSYFSKPNGFRIQKLVERIRRIDYEKTDTAIEALILESALIKKHQPEWNVREKDDKSFLYVEVTRERFPRVLLARGKDVETHPNRSRYFGPFTSAGSLKEALRIIRRIFPWNIHSEEDLKKLRRPCFDSEIGICPGACTGNLSESTYQKTVHNILLFLNGKKRQVVKNLEREMKIASKALRFEDAARLKRQIFALKHIQDIALITEDKIASHTGAFRIEGYDISNISGTSAVGAMVVFESDAPNKNEYRKFRIRTVLGANDVGMLKEVLLRRFQNPWPHPKLILIDGGKPQVNAAREVLKNLGAKIPVVGIAKGPKRKNNEFHGPIPPFVAPRTLIRVRDEAHRFAIKYHRALRERL